MGWINELKLNLRMANKKAKGMLSVEHTHKEICRKADLYRSSVLFDFIIVRFCVRFIHSRKWYVLNRRIWRCLFKITIWWWEAGVGADSASGHCTSFSFYKITHCSHGNCNTLFKVLAHPTLGRRHFLSKYWTCANNTTDGDGYYVMRRAIIALPLCRGRQ